MDGLVERAPPTPTPPTAGANRGALSVFVLDASECESSFLGQRRREAASRLPRLAPSGEGELANGNVVTVEPGVYVPGDLGVRIEDLVVVTRDGHDVLSSLPKSLQVIG